MFNRMDDGCLITFSDVVCFLWYFPLCNWTVCLLNCSHHFCQSSMPSCISSCLFPSQMSHLPTSSLPACYSSCSRCLCSGILYLTSGLQLLEVLSSQLRLEQNPPGSLGAEECEVSKEPFPLLALSLPHLILAGMPDGLGWWLSPGCPAASPRALQPCPCSRGSPWGWCLQSWRGLPCPLACGMSLPLLLPAFSALRAAEVSIGSIQFEEFYNLL